MSTHHKFMKEAITLSISNIKNNGGPFGAIIVKNNKIIGRGVNRVTANNDPTAHAEINAIREAAQLLNNYDLSGCSIYTSCEPCPMCLGAIYWAHINIVYYANNKLDAAQIGFDDKFIYEELDRPMQNRKLKFIQLDRESALEGFKKWDRKPDKSEY